MSPQVLASVFIHFALFRNQPLRPKFAFHPALSAPSSL